MTKEINFRWKIVLSYADTKFEIICVRSHSTVCCTFQLVSDNGGHFVLFVASIHNAHRQQWSGELKRTREMCANKTWTRYFERMNTEIENKGQIEKEKEINNTTNWRIEQKIKKKIKWTQQQNTNVEEGNKSERHSLVMYVRQSTDGGQEKKSEEHTHALKIQSFLIFLEITKDEKSKKPVSSCLVCVCVCVRLQEHFK